MPRKKVRFVVRRGSVESFSEKRSEGGANTDIVPVPVLSGRVSPVAKTDLIRLRYWCSSCSLSADMSRRGYLLRWVAVEQIMITCTRLVAPAALSRFDQKLSDRSICQLAHQSPPPTYILLPPKRRPWSSFKPPRYIESSALIAVHQSYQTAQIFASLVFGIRSISQKEFRNNRQYPSAEIANGFYLRLRHGRLRDRNRRSCSRSA